MMTGLVQDQNLEKQIEKQMGCMSGFLQLFDRQQILAGKRTYSPKRLPPSTAVAASTEPVKVVESPAVSRELGKPETPKSVVVNASPNRFQSSPVTELRPSSPGSVLPLDTPPKSPLPLPIFELKEGTRSSWKFCKETPRLSLDSRAIVDAKGSLCPREIRTVTSVLSANGCNNSAVDGEDKQRRSPSVIARLMGLEPLPSNSNPEIAKKPELRRSASESRVSRDLFQCRFIDGNNLQLKLPNQSHSTSNAVRDNVASGSNTPPSNVRPVDPMGYSSRNVKSEQPRTSPWSSPQQRRSFFDSTDFFPEPKPTAVSIYGDFEKRLKMRGIDEQSKDLETLKQILEALQLKGLLHSTKSSNRSSHWNFVYDRRFAAEESPIVLMKPCRSPASNDRRVVNDSGVRRNLNLTGENVNVPPGSPRRERSGTDRSGRSPVRTRNLASPTRNDSDVKSCNSIIKSKPLSIETQRRVNESSEPRRVSPNHSPKLTSKRFGPDQANTNRSPRNKKPTAQIHSKDKTSTNIVTEDESSSISESTVSTSSQTDTERPKMEEYREGRSLLERCDKLLHSIAEMNSTELQPSPVSVLDSSFYKEESSSPSPVMKRSIDFKDPAVELENEIWSPAISPVKSTICEEDISEDCDFVYISEIFRAFRYLPEDSDIFLLLEKQQYLKGKDTSKVSKLERKLIFDIIAEIVDRNRQLPPSKAFSLTGSGVAKPSLRQIWCEFQRIRERDTADDLLELICGVLRKDLAGINGWGDHPVEMSESALDIERLIFKDLVSETIRDLAEFTGKSTTLGPRRKLVFSLSETK